METYNIRNHVKGDTFPGLTFSILVNEQPLDLTGASIRMQIRQSPTHPVSHELSSENGNFEITNAAAGEFMLKKQIIDFPAGNWYYDIELTLADGDIKTYIGGRWVILQDVTR